MESGLKSEPLVALVQQVSLDPHKEPHRAGRLGDDGID